MGSNLIQNLKSTPKDWELVKLKDISLKIGSGSTPRGGESVYLNERQEFAFIRSQNVFDHYFNSDGIRYISDVDAEKLKHVSLKKNDILLNITGDGITFSRCCIVPNEILPAAVNQHVCIIRVDQTRCLPYYLLAYLCLPEIKEYIESFNAGGSRRAITKGHIESFDVLLPPMHIQKSIEQFTKTILTKIVLNTQMNQTLEQMAQTLFKSWFVDFDPVIDNALDAGNEIPEQFAVRAEIRKNIRATNDFKPSANDIRQLFPNEFEESELGWIPKGWRIKTTKDFGTVICGKTPSKKREDYYFGEIPFVKIPDMHGNVFVTDTTDKLSRLGSQTQPKKLIPRNSIMVSSIATVGLVTIASQDCHTNQQINSIVLKDIVYRDYLYFSMLSKNDYFHVLASAGSTTLNMNTTTFSNVKMLEPEFHIIKEFHKKTTVFFEKLLWNEYQNKNLTKLRDTLLPKLISGELRLDEVEARMNTAEITKQTESVQSEAVAI